MLVLVKAKRNEKHKIIYNDTCIYCNAEEDKAKNIFYQLQAHWGRYRDLGLVDFLDYILEEEDSDE